MEKNRTLSIKLYPEISNFTRENPPVASFIIRLISSLGDRQTLIHPGKIVLKFINLFLCVFVIKAVFFFVLVFCRSCRQATQE